MHAAPAKASWERHPRLRILTQEEARSLPADRLGEFLAERERRIHLERTDPLAHGYNPPIWRVCDALLDLNFYEKSSPDWMIQAEESERIRRGLGWMKPARIIMALGGNRASKTRYASTRVMKQLLTKRESLAFCCHTTLDTSASQQQPLFWEYMPANLKTLATKDAKSATTYLAYKRQTGFSGQKFILPNLSTCQFFNYSQDVDVLEGDKPDCIWPDELVPPQWIETAALRLATKNGWMIFTFTPVRGYTPTVRLFTTGARMVKESIAYLLPDDGGPADIARALGFPDERTHQVAKATGPNCLPENCLNWSVTEKAIPSQPAPPPGRKFKKVPRLLKCARADKSHDEARAIVHFHTSDNPYGGPEQVWDLISARPADFIAERFYGIAKKNFSARFAKWNDDVHIIPHDQIPAAGTNYQIVDPSSARNFAIGYVRIHPDDTATFYREFPGPEPIPGVGTLGPWAVPDGKKHDGRPGEGQRALGWGHLDYKQFFAHCEGWRDYKEINSDESRDDLVRAWDELNGAKEPISDRYIDSRFGSAPKIQNDEPTTLIEEFAELGLIFKPTPGSKLADGNTAIDALLSYDDKKPASSLNRPKLRFSDRCPNLIFAMQTWTGEDGETGACKDFRDIVAYFALLWSRENAIGYFEEGSSKPEQGFYR